MYGKENKSDVLHIADSLFENKQYTEAVEMYEYFYHSGYYTPRMLARVALIKEGLGDYTQALYYLNIYYSKIPDGNVLKKMDELATRYNLEGYEYNDLLFFISLYDRYYRSIVWGFMASGILIIILLFAKRKTGNKLIISIISTVYLALFYLVSSGVFIPEKAIVAEDVLLMSAPSAGSDIKGRIGKGHRVNIKGRKDIWVEISWHNEPMYIRENKLLFIQPAKRKK